MNLIPSAIAVLAIPALLLLDTSTCVAGPQEIKGPPKDDIYHPAVKGSCTVPPELKDFRLLRSEPLKITNAEEFGYDLAR